jgi:hypothetical protein
MFGLFRPTYCATVVTTYSYKKLQESRIKEYDKVQSEGRELFIRKNKTYGDSFARYGPIGVLVRIGDKISRLQQIDNTGINMVYDESLRDTLIDLHNYSAMAIMLLDKKKNDTT